MPSTILSTLVLNLYGSILWLSMVIQINMVTKQAPPQTVSISYPSHTTLLPVEFVRACRWTCSRSTWALWMSFPLPPLPAAQPWPSRRTDGMTLLSSPYPIRKNTQQLLSYQDKRLLYIQLGPVPLASRSVQCHVINSLRHKVQYFVDIYPLI